MYYKKGKDVSVKLSDIVNFLAVFQSPTLTEVLMDKLTLKFLKDTMKSMGLSQTDVYYPLSLMIFVTPDSAKVTLKA